MFARMRICANACLRDGVKKTKRPVIYFIHSGRLSLWVSSRF
jgi:hypothetical protein